MFQGKPRRFRSNIGGRNSMSRNNQQSRLRSNSFTNGQPRNNFRQALSPEKSFEKYSSLAKEAMSSGDQTLSENYFQHADHFMRVIEDRNRNRTQHQNKTNVIEKHIKEDKKYSKSDNNNQQEVTKK